MNWRSRHWLLLIPVAVLLLVSADGDSLQATKLVQPMLASLAAPRSLSVPEDKAAPAAELNTAPQQSKAPEAGEGSLADEVRRVRQDRLACVADAGGSADLFAGKSWYVPPPPPPPPKPVPPPQPTAPPLPFTFMGSYQEPDGRQVFFLTKGERLYTVSAGDMIDGMYRVEEFAAGQLGLTYLPLNIRQSMSVGETS